MRRITVLSLNTAEMAKDRLSSEAVDSYLELEEVLPKVGVIAPFGRATFVSITTPTKMKLVPLRYCNYAPAPEDYEQDTNRY